ncbi:MAG: glycosyltransferase family 2 protein [Candidatus Omnitrophota bacterium]|jgi:GT2 family glycosyltransferase
MISVVIANYNSKDLLRQCLGSLRRQSFRDIEVIVVDNASKDGSVEMLESFYPEARLIKNTTNLLFCRAQNQGINTSRGSFILCLNSDVVLDKDYLKEALRAVASEANIGMISGKIMRPDGKIIDSTGLFLGRNRKAVERGYGKPDKGQYDEPGYVFGVTGACAFLKKDMLEDIKDKNGYFDEDFGMYYEDLDICWRANKKGWKCYYNPKAMAYHVRGGTAVGQGAGRGPNVIHLSGDLRAMYIANRYKCMKKNDTVPGFLINLPFILWYNTKLYIYFLLYRSRLLDAIWRL